jgi:hypothetical protein
MKGAALYYNNRPALMLYRLLQESARRGFHVGDEDPWNHLESWEHHTLSDITDAIRRAPADISDQEIDDAVDYYNGLQK